MNKDKFDLQSAVVPFQMHDEEINRIVLTDNSLQLCFDHLHFETNHSKAIIEFIGMEDVSCCAHMDVYTVSGSEISGGRRYFADEFESIFADGKISLVIVDMWLGYGGQLMITGTVSEDNTLGDKSFSLLIEAASMSFNWY